MSCMLYVTRYLYVSEHLVCCMLYVMHYSLHACQLYKLYNVIENFYVSDTMSTVAQATSYACCACELRARVQTCFRFYTRSNPTMAAAAAARCHAAMFGCNTHRMSKSAECAADYTCCVRIQHVLE